MEINPTDFSLHLIETNVIKSFKACSSDCFDPMIGNKEMFFPPHEYVFVLMDILDPDRAPASLIRKLLECRELRPMAEVNLLIGAPVFVLCIKAIFGTNDFPFKICRKSWMILRQPCVVQ